MAKYAFQLYIDSPLARELWDDGMVLESVFTTSNNSKNYPRADDVVEDALFQVFNLDDSRKEHIMLKRVFTEALNNQHSFDVKFDLKNSSS